MIRLALRNPHLVAVGALALLATAMLGVCVVIGGPLPVR
jgi:hypothetical protein